MERAPPTERNEPAPALAGRKRVPPKARDSMGSVGECYDNAMAESFFASLECELLDRVHFDDHRHAQREIFSYIEGRYNPHRRHQGLGYQSPIDFERSHRDAA